MKFESKYDICDVVLCKMALYDDTYKIEEVIFKKDKILYKLFNCSLLFAENDLYKLEIDMEVSVNYKKDYNDINVIGKIISFTKDTFNLILEDGIVISNIPFNMVEQIL